MDSLLKYRYSFAAGSCAAGGSFFGKLPSFLEAQKVLFLTDNAPATILPPEVEIYLEFVLLRALPIVLMVICNLLNWRYFLKALQTSEQTLTATVLAAASNYMISFILASLIYREPISMLSAVGSTLIVAGLWFLCGAQQETETIKSKIS